ncbi:hypothetical protein BKA61DRAFT_611681 [Leptodontidium sp. MPI-SDFR-AT-0119]|nr:hypothetical protein BKA61DRAFT_611681 [Leptodontidium sp. MPI-SDFR-AT-0119]
MTGGIEIVGVVLALYPLIIDAWQAFKATTKEAEVRHMITRLATEQIVFNALVDQLVGDTVSKAERANLDNASPRHRGQHGEHANDHWQKPELQANLKRTLGYSKMQNILAIVANIYQILKSMSIELRPSRPLLKRRPRDILRGVFSPHKPSRHQLKHLKQSLNNLREYNDDLQRLLCSPFIPISAEMEKKQFPSLGQSDFTHSSNIFKAMYNTYTCSCDTPHLVTLKLPKLVLGQHDDSLDERSATTTASLELLISNAESTDPNIASGPLETPESYSRYDTEKHDRCTQESSSLDLPITGREDSFWSFTSKNSHKKAPAAQTGSYGICQMTVEECFEEHAAAIEDLCTHFRKMCNAIQESQDLPEREPSTISSQNKRYTVKPSQSSGKHGKTQIPISLHDFLQDQFVSKRVRMRVGLQLSFAILHHYSTGWIDPEWTWRDLSISQGHGQFPEDSQLYIKKKFFSIHKKSSSTLWVLIKEQILTRLGFALIELALGKRLADLGDPGANNHDGMEPDIADYFTARNILEEGVLVAEQGKEYASVVRVCLDHQFYSHSCVSSLDSRQKSFHRDMETSVILPLHSLWETLWGGNKN